MRFIRFLESPNGHPTWGWLADDGIGILEGSPFDQHHRQEPSLSTEAVKLLAPVRPSKIICVGRNFPAHASEHQTEVPKCPLLFLKPPSAIIGNDEEIILPPQSKQVEHEAELAVVIGKGGRWIREEDAEQHIFGYSAANDVTARDLQWSDAQWTRGKGFDTFCPVGPWIETHLELEKTYISCSVNGERRQYGCLTEAAFSVPTLIAYCSTVMTLDPGDLILTGTPSGVGPLVEGDLVTVEVSNLGRLSNPVRADKQGSNREKTKARHS